MSAQAKKKIEQKKPANSVPASVVWFEIPADDLGRAKAFYGSLFGWKIQPMPGMADYLHIDTGGHDASPDAGMMKRRQPQQQITNYVLVESVTKAMAKVEKLGGKVCMPKTAVPQMGYFAICQDTENNTFAVWQKNDKAK